LLLRERPCGSSCNKKLRVAKYIRLSREDGDDRESESVENQRHILDRYIRENEEFMEMGEYIDDGYSGTNFDRPGFNRMLKDIEAGKVDCIITKDLSRFGRDHIDTGYYLERFLPKNNIKYIAINDNVDTSKSDGMQFLTFKLSFNDYYAQDISTKIKSVKREKQKNGEYQAGIPPYGYLKDQTKKNHLVLDPVAAPIIKEIFDLYVNKGMSTIKIADLFNERGLTPPGIHLQIPTFIKQQKQGKNFVWLRYQVGKILKSEYYIGTVVGKKSETISHKLKNVRSFRIEDQIKVENKHEAIIDREIWEKAQERLSGFKRVRDRKYDHPLKGLVFCAECGNKATLRCREATRKNGNIWRITNFICSKRNNYIGLCDCKQINAKLIMNAVRTAIEKEIHKVNFSKSEIETMYSEAEKRARTKKSVVECRIAELNENLHKKEKELDIVYQDRINNIVTADYFQKYYEKTEKAVNSIKDEIKKEEAQLISAKRETKKTTYIEIEDVVTEFLKMENPPKEVFIKLIDKIYFDKDKNIEVNLNFEQVLCMVS